MEEELNCFFTRFELESPTASLQTSSYSSPILQVEVHEMRRTLKAVNPRKAAGPHGVTGHMPLF